MVCVATKNYPCPVALPHARGYLCRYGKAPGPIQPQVPSAPSLLCTSPLSHPQGKPQSPPKADEFRWSGSPPCACMPRKAGCSSSLGQTLPVAVQCNSPGSQGLPQLSSSHCSRALNLPSTSVYHPQKRASEALQRVLGGRGTVLPGKQLPLKVPLLLCSAWGYEPSVSSRKKK